jgi:hypothetical protein
MTIMITTDDAPKSERVQFIINNNHTNLSCGSVRGRVRPGLERQKPIIRNLQVEVRAVRRVLAVLSTREVRLIMKNERAYAGLSLESHPSRSFRHMKHLTASGASAVPV